MILNLLQVSENDWVPVYKFLLSQHQHSPRLWDEDEQPELVKIRESFKEHFGKSTIVALSQRHHMEVKLYFIHVVFLVQLIDLNQGLGSRKFLLFQFLQVLLIRFGSVLVPWNWGVVWGRNGWFVLLLAMTVISHLFQIDGLAQWDLKLRKFLLVGIHLRYRFWYPIN